MVEGPSEEGTSCHLRSKKMKLNFFDEM